MEEIIALHQVTKIYTSGTVSCTALQDISFTVQKGEMISLVGPSGSGKTTTLNLMGCMDSPTKGTILLDTVNVTALPSSALTEIRREKIGFIFQTFNLLQALTVYENIELPLVFDNVSATERRKRVASILETVGLQNVARHRVTDISGGQQQRTAIARALIKNPLFVLADEPTGNLDLETGTAIMELMKRLNQSDQVTFIIATHDPLVVSYTGRAITFRDGKVSVDINAGA